MKKLLGKHIQVKSSNLRKQVLFVLLFAGSFILSSSPAIAASKMPLFPPVSFGVLRGLSLLFFGVSVVVFGWFLIWVFDGEDVANHNYFILSALAVGCGFLFVLLTYGFLE
jgi:uncharacterized membrane protein YozB (DUF420 family)